jgi:sec-independent protein translocase protein TatC
MLLSFCISIVLNIPYILYQCLSFFCWGLFEYESKDLLRKSILMLLSLFVTFYVYIFILKDFIVSFFVDFEMSLLVHTIRIEDFVSFLLFLVLLTLLTLLIPLISVYFIGFRKYFYFLTFLVSALLTPPDVFSLIFVSIPIIIIFELRLFYHHLI